VVRFLACRFLERTQESFSLPSGDTFTVRKPRGSKLLSWPIEKITSENLRKLTVDEVVHDIYLYLAFLEFLRSIYSSENLLCLRAMSVFHCFWVDTTKPLDRFGYPEGTEEGGWRVYRYFIAVGSAFEVSVPDRLRKDIMLCLARPTIHMFDALEKLTQNNLKHLLQQFYRSKFFDGLADRIIADRNMQESHSKCFLLCG